MAEATANTTDQNINTAIKIGGAIAVFIVGKKVLEFFNIINTKEENEAEQGATNLENTYTSPASGDLPPVTLPNKPEYSLTPTYWLTIYKFYLQKYPNKTFDRAKQEAIPTSKLVKLPEMIYKAKGLFNDDEEKLYSVFRMCETQYQVSLMAWYFNYIYKIDLYTYIKSFTNVAERNEIYKILKNYPQVYKYW